jgi:hypothetical protein
MPDAGRIHVPAGYKISQDGDTKIRTRRSSRTSRALGLSILLMYLVMALLFESTLFRPRRHLVPNNHWCRRISSRHAQVAASILVRTNAATD